MAEMDYKQVAQPYVGSETDLQDVLFPSRTTAQLASLTDRINTVDKFAGKVVWNSTASILVVAVGAAANSVWNGVHDNGLDHTPV